MVLKVSILRLPRAKRSLFLALLLSPLFILPAANAVAPPSSPWSAKFDGGVRFHQTTELGALIVGTEKSLYAVDGETGEILWRRKDIRLDESDVAPIVGTDLLLLSFEKGGKTRVEGVDLMSGNVLWRSDKIKGGVMQMAVDPENDLAAVVFVRDAKAGPKAGFKRRPTLHLLNLATGDELWKRDLESEVEMTPARWSGDGDETFYTLDNYRAPFFLDGRRDGRDLGRRGSTAAADHACTEVARMCGELGEVLGGGEVEEAAVHEPRKPRVRHDRERHVGLSPEALHDLEELLRSHAAVRAQRVDAVPRERADDVLGIGAVERPAVLQPALVPDPLPELRAGNLRGCRILHGADKRVRDGLKLIGDPGDGPALPRFRS